MHPKVLCLVLVHPFVWTSACDIPGTPAGGFIKHSRWKESFEEGDSLEYECSGNYHIVPMNSFRRTCINGSWSVELPVCAKLYRTSSMLVCPMSGRTKCNEMPYCLSVDNKPEFWKINLGKLYHISAVAFYHYSPLCEEGFYDHYINISASSNSTTRYFDSTKTSSSPFGRNKCRNNYYYHIQDNSSPLANTINIEVNKLPEEEEVQFCYIIFYGNEFPAETDCGQPDSPLYSVINYSNHNRTALIECMSGYRAVGNTSVSHCTEDLRWTTLDMKCIKSEDFSGMDATELPPKDIQTGVNDLKLALILLLPFGLLVVILSAILGQILYRRWQKRREQKNLIEEFKRMKENRRVALNSDIPLDAQADLLWYKRRWEFPKERLKLGKCIGEGAFGTVVKAEAIGIIAGESRTTVAVKMVKYKGNEEHMQALLIELKILAYVGHHINIVNLLGAVTKNLAKGELMVITEYCEFGNLRNFLLCQRDRFFNQVDPETGDLTTDIDAVPTLSANDEGKDYQHRTSREESKHFLQGTFQSSLHECGQKILSIPPVSTRDLISYAFQCARGMEFLSSKKLVHRDLAARNVLVAENKVVKICDFGLSRKTYQEYAYVRKGKGPLPIKWMAIESICDGVFTPKSDVWSFGVLLWEVFTLGADPYPGVECNEEFYEKLKGGYRLKKPDLAPKVLHNIMQKTWQENPKDRPTFTEIAEMLGNLLEESVRSYYLDLNVPHSQFNEAVAQDMLFKSTMVSDNNAIGEGAVSEIRESDVKTDPLVCIDVAKQFITDLASLEESRAPSALGCVTTNL